LIFLDYLLKKAMAMQLFTADMYITILDKGIKDIYKTMKEEKTDDEKLFEIQKIVNEVLGRGNKSEDIRSSTF
jgi:uncharacterized metal-binding protein